MHFRYPRGIVGKKPSISFLVNETCSFAALTLAEHADVVLKVAVLVVVMPSITNWLRRCQHR